MSTSKKHVLTDILEDKPKDNSSNAIQRPPARPARAANAKRDLSSSPTVRLAKENESLKEETKAQKDQIQNLESKVQKLNEQIGSATASDVGKSIQLHLPGTDLTVDAILELVDPDCVDITLENQRDQSLLDEHSLSDILPSIKEDGQTMPGLSRKESNGRYTGIWGSRRRAAVKILGRQFLTYVADIPDSYFESLAKIENKFKSVSPWEMAKYLSRKISAGIYRDWSHAASSYGISNSSISRLNSLLKVDKVYIECFPSPNDVPKTFGTKVLNLEKRDAEACLSKARELKELKSQWIDDGLSSEEIAKLIVRELTKSIPIKPVSTPTTGRVQRYVSNSDMSVSVSKTKNKTLTAKFTDLSLEELAELQEWATKRFGLKEAK